MVNLKKKKKQKRREKKNSLTEQREFEDAEGGEGYRLGWKGVM